MKVIISFEWISRFFNLAKQLHFRGKLYRLYMPYYYAHFSYIGENCINLKHIRVNEKIGFISKVLSTKLISKIIPSSKRNNFLTEMFDRWVAKDLDNGASIIFCQAGNSLHTIRKAKKLGIITVLDSTGSHIDSAYKLLIDEYRSNGIKFNRNYAWLLKRTLEEYKEADYISVLSSFAKKTFIKNNIPEHKLRLILPGIDLTCFRQVKKEDKVFRIIYVGHSCLRKGTHYLLEAFNSLKLANAELWLIGHIANDFRKHIKKYEGNFKAFGYINNNELYKYYSQGSVCVLPSIDDGFNKVMLEAMACGLPVITTVNTGGADVIDDATDGFVVPVRDAEALKKKILYMYENHDICEQMGQKAKEKIRQKFTVEHYADRVLAAYDNLSVS